MWRPRIPFRRPADIPEQDRTPDSVPAWVNHFRRWGLPTAAIIVLVLCAPGEQHLAHLAGWSYKLSWGMAGLFTLYAGLAAVISTQLPKGARGKRSSIWGAVFSLGLAMGAQPVAHLFVTGWLSAEPRPPVSLIVAVSSVPPLILGHLLHFAAMPPVVRPARPADIQTPDTTVSVDRPAVPVPSWVTEEKARRTAEPRPVPVRPAPALSAGQPSDLTDKQNLSARALVLAQDGSDKDTIKDKLRAEFPDAKTDSVRKAADRAVDKVSAAS